MDRGAWWATVHGVTKSQTQKWLTLSQLWRTALLWDVPLVWVCLMFSCDWVEVIYFLTRASRNDLVSCSVHLIRRYSWRNVAENKISPSLNPLHKGGRERKHFCHWICVKSEYDMNHRQSTKRFQWQKEILLFYIVKQVPPTACIHVFKIITGPKCEDLKAPFVTHRSLSIHLVFGGDYLC